MRHWQFSTTKRFTAAVALINGTPSDRFPHLLSRVLGQLHAKAERVFSAEEEAALCELFGFSDEQLELLLSSCSFIFEQAAYLATAPAKLGDELLKAGVPDGHTLQASSALRKLCTDYAEGREAVVGAGGVPLLATLARDASGDTKTNATEALKALHASHRAAVEQAGFVPA